jgi:Prenyltransferase and squalene oxidase repeat
VPSFSQNTLRLGLLVSALAPGLAAQPPAKMVVKRKIVDVSKESVVLVDRAVERGLAWLASQQNDKGFWEGVVGTKTRDRYEPLHSIELQKRDGTGHVGVTAICGMAFLSGGHVPGRGKYGKVVQDAVHAVLSAIREDGIITLAGTQMYSHAFATLFLAEVYGMSRDITIKKGLERAVHIVVDCQNAQGAWRYTPFSRESDVSVTVCQLQALRAARNIGIQVPKSVVERAVAYIKGCRVTRGWSSKGRYYYDSGRRGRKSNSYSIQAAAVTSLVSAGVYDRELIDPAMEFLADELPELMRNYPHHFFFWYGNYYASQAFYHADRGRQDGSFQDYYVAIRDHLLDDQKKNGRWLNPTNQGPGDAFGTAVACMILQIPNQYLPIFQR